MARVMNGVLGSPHKEPSPQLKRFDWDTVMNVRFDFGALGTRHCYIYLKSLGLSTPATAR